MAKPDITVLDLDSSNVACSVQVNHDAGLVMLAFDFREEGSPYTARAFVGLNEAECVDLRAKLYDAERELEKARGG